MARCTRCNTDNRESANFCKKCGTAIQKDSRKQNSTFYGKEHILPELDKFRKRASIACQLKKAGGNQVGIDCILSGDTGTGKNFLAEELNEILLKEKVISKTRGLDKSFTAACRGYLKPGDIERNNAVRSRQIVRLEKILENMAAGTPTYATSK